MYSLEVRTAKICTSPSPHLTGFFGYWYNLDTATVCRDDKGYLSQKICNPFQTQSSCLNLHRWDMVSLILARLNLVTIFGMK